MCPSSCCFYLYQYTIFLLHSHIRTSITWMIAIVCVSIACDRFRCDSLLLPHNRPWGGAYRSFSYIWFASDRRCRLTFAQQQWRPAYKSTTNNNWLGGLSNTFNCVCCSFKAEHKKKSVFVWVKRESELDSATAFRIRRIVLCLNELNELTIGLEWFFFN